MDKNNFRELQSLGNENYSWGQLTPELLQMTIRMMADEPDTWKKSLLSCRLVNRHWKSSTDKVLEDAFLKHWTTWQPSNRYRQPITFPNITLISTTREMPLDWVLCPESLLSQNEYEFTIPTKSLCLQFPNERSELNRNYKLTKVVELFPACGANLFNLEIFNCTLRPSVLRNVLQHVPNLKALTIGEVDFNKTHFYGQNNNVLVPLESPANLQHFKYVSEYGSQVASNFSANKWIISSLASQLVTLETDIDFVSFLEEDLTSNFPKLKTLIVSVLFKETPSETLLQTRFPVLERVSFVLGNDYDTPMKRLHNISHFLGNVADTVTHLHLVFQHIPLENLFHQTNFPSLPKLKHLGILWPFWNGDWLLIQNFLQVCPCLKTLDLFNCLLPSSGEDVINNMKIIATEKVKKNILDVFPGIKEISVHSRWTEDSKFCKMWI